MKSKKNEEFIMVMGRVLGKCLVPVLMSASFFSPSVYATEEGNTMGGELPVESEMDSDISAKENYIIQFGQVLTQMGRIDTSEDEEKLRKLEPKDQSYRHNTYLIYIKHLKILQFRLSQIPEMDTFLNDTMSYLDELIEKLGNESTITVTHYLHKPENRESEIETRYITELNKFKDVLASLTTWINANQNPQGDYGTEEDMRHFAFEMTEIKKKNKEMISPYQYQEIQELLSFGFASILAYAALDKDKPARSIILRSEDNPEYTMTNREIQKQNKRYFPNDLRMRFVIADYLKAGSEFNDMGNAALTNALKEKAVNLHLFHETFESINEKNYNYFNPEISRKVLPILENFMSFRRSQLLAEKDQTQSKANLLVYFSVLDRVAKSIFETVHMTIYCIEEAEKKAQKAAKKEAKKNKVITSKELISRHIMP